jgi:hypothetical protein
VPTVTPGEEYKARLAAHRAAEARLTRQHERIGNLRLATSAVAAFLAWQVVGRGAIAWTWLLVPAAVFLVLMIWHDRVLRARGRAERGAAFYEQGLARLEDRWAGTGESGVRFLVADHPYAADLDLFGAGSLFELLTTARIRAGEETLARWLLAPAAASVVRARHAAIDDLRFRLDLREDLAVLGTSGGARIDPAVLTSWGAAPPVVTSPWPALVAAVLGGVGLVTAAGWAAGLIGGLPFALVLLAEITYSVLVRSRVNAIIRTIDGPAHDLALLSEVLERFERETFSAPRLLDIRASLATAGQPPSQRVARLERLVDLLHSRHNQLFAPIAILALWGAQFAFAIERWRRVSGPRLGVWLEALGELEALCSLAGYAYEHPDDPFPEIVDEERARFEGDEMTHPLLSSAKAVRNSVHLGVEPQMLLVSGSNMSGKSTLLRTVGVNAVLALAGAPVRAARLRMTPVAVGATLRVQDSLQAGQSRFYAEIMRLRQIVALTSASTPVLFLLDELLSGTNSHDRLHGGEAIVRGLLDRGAIGLVTTHDLALAAIADRLAPRAANVHFADELRDGTLCFDYRMRPGVVQGSNALALMRAVGLDV